MAGTRCNLNEYMRWLAAGPRDHSNMAELVRAHQRLAFATGLLERVGPEHLIMLPFDTLRTLFVPGDAVGAARIRAIFAEYFWLTDVTERKMRRKRGLGFDVSRTKTVSQETKLVSQEKCAIS